MNDDKQRTANDQRLLANQIMYDLYVAGEVEQLKILVQYGKAALEMLNNERK